MNILWKSLKVLFTFFTLAGTATEGRTDPFRVQYRYEKGRAEKIQFDGELSFLQWNVCLLPRHYPLVYGGVEKSMKRIERIAQFIARADADIVSLQEAHDHKAVNALIKMLKDRYAHIYHDIGTPSSFVGFDIHQPFLNSGLVVMSKYPLRNTAFKSYDYADRQWQINKGYFEFTVFSEEKKLIHCITTHLQPYDSEKDENIREKEVLEVSRVIASRSKISNGEIPGVLFGDLNIPWGSPEYDNSSLLTYFDDSYSENIERVTPKNCTVTDFLIDYRNHAVNHEHLKSIEWGVNTPYAAIVDYFLVFKEIGNCRFDTTLLETFPTDFTSCGDAVLEALSDHKALYTTIVLPIKTGDKNE